MKEYREIIEEKFYKEIEDMKRLCPIERLYYPSDHIRNSLVDILTKIKEELIKEIEDE